jgi:hypothetical protein
MRKLDSHTVLVANKAVTLFRRHLSFTFQKTRHGNRIRATSVTIFMAAIASCRALCKVLLESIQFPQPCLLTKFTQCPVKSQGDGREHLKAIVKTAVTPHATITPNKLRLASKLFPSAIKLCIRTASDAFAAAIVATRSMCAAYSYCERIRARTRDRNWARTFWYKTKSFSETVFLVLPRPWFTANWINTTCNVPRI